MKHFARLIGLTVAIGCGVARAGEGVDNDGIWFCQSIQGAPTETLYVSEHFDGQFDPGEVPDAFKRMVAAKYGADVKPSCSHAYRGPGILAKIKGDKQRWYGQIRASGGKVVETHWAFAPQAERIAYVCFGGAQYAKNGAPAYSFFHTDAIEMPGSEQAKLAEAWDAYLEAQHPGWSFPYKGCNLIRSGQTAQLIIDSHTQSWMPQKAEIIHVDWKYAPALKSAVGDVPSEFCQALRSDNKYWYVTPVFPMASLDQANAARNEWGVYLRGLKDADGIVVADSYLDGCDGPAPAKGLEHQRAARREQIKDGGGRVFELEWRPRGGPSAAAATAEAAAAAAAAPTWQCFMAAFGGSYMTPAFASRKEPTALRSDWSAYIRSAHPPAPGVVQTDCVEVQPKTPIGSGYTRLDWSE